MGMASWADTRLFRRGRGVVERNWRRALRVREQFEFTEEGFHLIVAGIVGVMGGVSNLLLHYAIESTKFFLLHHPGDPVEIAEALAPWQRAAAPALGGLAAGLVLYWGLRLVGQQGTTSLLEAVVAGDGRLPFRTSMVRIISSVLSIASGASLGREGAVTAASSMLASKLGQLFHWPAYRLRLLVGCGAASGIAAAYNAPIAGAVFAATMVLGNFSMRLLAPLIFASVVATVVSRGFFGIQPWYTVPAYEFTSIWDLPWFVVLGALCGAVGVVFQRALRWSGDFFRRLGWPLYVRVCLGGVVVGLIAIQFPGVWGNGYEVTNRILQEEFLSQQWPLIFLLLLMAAKFTATSAAIGSGAVGGLITPTMFLGAGTGAILGTALLRLGWVTGIPVGLFAAVGMGCLLSSTTRSPLLAMILLFEISLDYALMPALMLGCAVATLSARRFQKESVYTEHLRLRGVLAEADFEQHGGASERTVGDLMRAPVPPVRDNATFSEMAHRFLSSANNFVPVVNVEQRLIGVIALHDLKEYLSEHEEVHGVIAYDIMRPPPPALTPNQRIVDALPVVLASELRQIPVVTSAADNRLIGSLPRAQILSIISEAIAHPRGSGQ